MDFPTMAFAAHTQSDDHDARIWLLSLEGNQLFRIKSIACVIIRSRCSQFPLTVM